MCILYFGDSVVALGSGDTTAGERTNEGTLSARTAVCFSEMDVHTCSMQA